LFLSSRCRGSFLLGARELLLTDWLTDVNDGAHRPTRTHRPSCHSHHRVHLARISDCLECCRGLGFSRLSHRTPATAAKGGALLSNGGASSRLFDAQHRREHRRLGYHSRLRATRCVVPHRTTQRARRGVAPNGGVHGGARGDEGGVAAGGSLCVEDILPGE